MSKVLRKQFQTLRSTTYDLFQNQMRNVKLDNVCEHI